MPEPLRVVLVETATPGQKGSMFRYADIVAARLPDGGPVPVRFQRLCLSLSRAWLGRMPRRLGTWVKHLAIAAAARRLLPSARADLFHIVDGSYAYLARWLPDAPRMATAHDLIPLLQLQGRFPVTPPSRWAARLVRESARQLRAMDRVVADSQRTRADLVEAAGVDPGRIEVVHLPVPPEVMRASRPGDATHRGSPEGDHPPCLLHVGNDAFYKNRVGVLRIFARVRASVHARLEMVGPEPSRELRSLVRDLEIAEHVRFVTDPSESELVELYRNASILLFPSLYEGFGWPPLEAMALGCPVVCSSAGSLPEVVGDAALTSAPDDEERLAALSLRILRDPSLADRLASQGRERARHFAVEAMTDRLLSIYRSVIERTEEVLRA